MKKASIITYGCQMNENESAKMRNIFEKLGYEMTEDLSKSDVIFLNTCTIREGAATKIYGKLGQIKRVNKKPDTIIGITGCFAQEQGKKLFSKFPQIDIVMGNQNIAEIEDAIKKIESQRVKHVVLTEEEDTLPPRLDATFDNDKTASISITYGCNNFCAYCIVPYVRGRERSVPMEEILHDVKQYVKQGYKEITLLGQNVNSYGNDFKNGDNFAKLLNEIGKIPGDYIVRFISPHPRDFTDDVIDAIAKNKNISKSLHLPLQSGSSKILKAMNRGYTKEQYIALAEKIKERIPGVGLTADIIVGFPGETEEDFQDTVDVVKTIGYENSFMFMYSIRQGTKAATMENQVDEKIKKDRLQRLIAAQNEMSLKLSQTYMGKTLKIFVEGESKKNKEVLSGRTNTNKIVLFKAPKSLIGSFVNVRIYDCKTWSLYGEIVE